MGRLGVLNLLGEVLGPTGGHLRCVRQLSLAACNGGQCVCKGVVCVCVGGCVCSCLQGELRAH